jgi:predicted nucleic acid-binding protein
MTMSADRALVDTNVLVYSAYPSAVQHTDSRALVESAKDPAAGLCVFPQILAEFFAVVTNPKRVTPPKTAEEGLQAIEQFLPPRARPVAPTG